MPRYDNLSTFFPLVAEQGCARAVNGDRTLARFVPADINMTPLAESLARRADAHQRARILRDALNRVPLPLLRVAHEVAARAFTEQGDSYEVAAGRQEAIGNGDPRSPRPFKGLQTIG